MADEISTTMLKALQAAAARERGNICPIARVHAAAEQQLIAAMGRLGFIRWDGAVPRISEAGRATVKRYAEMTGG